MKTQEVCDILNKELSAKYMIKFLPTPMSAAIEIRNINPAIGAVAQYTHILVQEIYKILRNNIAGMKRTYFSTNNDNSRFWAYKENKPCWGD